MSAHSVQMASGGFSVHRHLPATADRVFAAFVQPTKLEQWFVVPGYDTRADRMRVDPRPGGRMDAVMISAADGSEIPFGFEYAELDPPDRVVLRFVDPQEMVTVTLVANPSGGVDLTYEFVSWPGPTNEDAARRGVEEMLDHIESAISRGAI